MYEINRFQLEIKMLVKIKSGICFVVAVVLLLCSRDAMGQEPVDSTAMQRYVELDSIGAAMVSPPDSIVFQSNLDNIYSESDIIFISDTTDLTKIFLLSNFDDYAKHSPAKAAMMSAVMPGLGQIYNRKYWKLPLVYAAVGASVVVFLKWQNEYSRYRRAYVDINDRNPYTNYHKELGFPSYYTEEMQLQYITKRKDELRTWRDWSIVAVVAAYALNIIDANVDAHLMDFNLDDNISFNIQPCFLENNFNSQKIGLSLRFRF